MKKLILTLTVLIIGLQIRAQELNCRVTVVANNLQGEYANQVNKDALKTLEQGMTSFINERKWTDYTFSPNEKIECSIQLLLENVPSKDTYTGKIFVQLSRPVFNSVYSTPIFSFQDNDLSFVYRDDQTFEYDESSYLWTITSLLGFYANFMLGVTFDTYAPQGGTPFYDKCRNIVSSAPASETGWSNSSKDSRSKFWLLDSYSNPAYAVFRTYLYRYHRLGLDVMAQDLNKGTEEVVQALESLTELYRRNSNLYCFTLLGYCKSNELVNLLSAATATHKQRALEVLKLIDPTNMEKYNKIQ